MASFFDDFNRANGSPGSNWTDAAGTASIYNGYLTGAAQTYAIANQVSDGGYHEAEARVAFISGQTQTAGVLVKAAATGRTGYWAKIVLTADTYYLHIYRRDATVETSLGNTAIGTATPFLSLINLIWDNGDLTATCDGGSTVTAYDTTYATNGYMGLRLEPTYSFASDFRCYGTARSQLTVSPLVIGNYGDPVTVTFYGTGTTWTSGTPGSPTFTVDHGTLSNQEVVDEDTATATYDPGTYLGGITFTDPSTGATATAVVTSDPGVQPPTSGPGSLPQTVIDWLTMNAAHNGNLVYTEQTVQATHDELALGDWFKWVHDVGHVTAGPTPDQTATANQLLVLWRLINGLYPVPSLPGYSPSDLPLTHNLDNLHYKHAQLVGDPAWTLRTVSDIIGGDPFASNAEILAEIRALPAGSNQDVLDMLAAMWGVEQPTLTDIALILDNIRTIAGYDFSSVLTWIEAARGAGLPTIADVMTKLAKIQVGNVPDLQTIADMIVTAQAMTAIMNTVVLAIRGANGNTILDVMNALDDLPGQIDVSLKQPPIIAPTDTVTYGASFVLQEALQIDLPMHGIVVDVTDMPDSVRSYPVGDFSMIFRAGYCAFINPLGYVEEPQFLSFTKGIYTPKTCTQAIGVLVKPNQGQDGAVRPFNINAPA